MRRDVAAYLADVVEACDAIESALNGVDLAAYKGQRVTRSAVEREFMIIGEAIGSLR